MTPRNRSPQYVARRAELLAQLFLQDLDPEFVARPPTEDVGYDFLIAVSNTHGGTNTFAVEVKATESPVTSFVQVPREKYRKLIRSNIPVMLLVTDVKKNRYYYAWLRPGSHVKSSARAVALPINEIDEQTREQLREELRSPNPVAKASAG